MPTPKLPIGCGMHRARRNRKRPRRSASTTCSECGFGFDQVDYCTCGFSRKVSHAAKPLKQRVVKKGGRL